MGRVNVQALQGNSPDFKITLEANSTLSMLKQIFVF